MSGGVANVARYDAVADWYDGFVAADGGGFTTSATTALRDTLGAGTGVCWDVACGTGSYAATLRELGWTPFGTDVSFGQASHARRRLPVVVADATRPPLRPASVAAVASVNCHTDLDDYAALCRAVAVTLRPGGRFAHVGLHPAFIGGFADRADPRHVVITPGYWSRERTFDAWNPHGVRAKVGGVHLPLSDLFAVIIGAGLVVDAVTEYGEPTPDILAIRAHRPG